MKVVLIFAFLTIIHFVFRMIYRNALQAIGVCKPQMSLTYGMTVGASMLTIILWLLHMAGL